MTMLKGFPRPAWSLIDWQSRTGFPYGPEELRGEATPPKTCDVSEKSFTSPEIATRLSDGLFKNLLLYFVTTPCQVRTGCGVPGKYLQGHFFIFPAEFNH